MPDATPLPKSEHSLAEEELQNELRGMFELDTQTYLQTYEQVTQHISTETWTADIQELYRSIHTIKGGAVTVGADAVLATTTALEEMLSDLRYLQSAPLLADGQLGAVLVEAGEVVSGSLLITEEDEAAKSALASALDRLNTLHDQVREQFLTEIDEHQQICQDFANQGFDLMVLDLEMSLEQVAVGGQVSLEIINTAAQIFTDLETVGKDLEMESGWSLLMQPLFELLIESDSEIWRARSQVYLALLKCCALEGGRLTAAAKTQLEADGFTSVAAIASTDASFNLDSESTEFLDTRDDNYSGLFDLSVNPDNDESGLFEFFSDTEQEKEAGFELDQTKSSESFDTESFDTESFDLDWLTNAAISDEADNAANAPTPLADIQVEEGSQPPHQSTSNRPEAEAIESFLSDTPQPRLPQDTPFDSPQASEELDITLDITKEGQLLSAALKQIETNLSGMQGGSQDPDQDENQDENFELLDIEIGVPDDFLESLETIDDSELNTALDVEAPEWIIEPPESSTVQPPKAIAKDTGSSSKIPKIPVPLDRLERSSRALVEILLSARSTQGRYQSLANQVSKMVALSQESASYITRLRQMQDDYALLQNLSHQSSENGGVKLEGYRSGYMAINRLLENNLRLSEIGAEMAANAQVTKQEFSKLNQHIKVLQSSVEESRLISFKSVAFRLRAVVRDLINRIGKPVNFVIEGESKSLDAGTIQALEPALLHLLRNAYDHGLESPEERTKTSKPTTATIKLSLKQRGSVYHLSLADDGKGIDRQKITVIAQSKGLPLSQTETNEALLQVICQPGFSSQEAVSAISGRGVGMDVVNHQIQQLGGTLQLESTLGEGTRFDLKIPVPHLLVPCLVVKSGPQTLAIPTEAIQTMRLWDQSCRQRDDEGPSIRLPWEREFEGQIEPMMPIMQYWQAKFTVPDLNQSIMETAVCLRISANDSGSEAIWIVIDDIVEELDLLINQLPAPLKTPAGMMGMSMLPTGEMIPVLEATTIAQVLLKPDTPESMDISLSREPAPETTQQTQVNANLILVVDDAALLRRRLEVSLLNYGYEVQCCRDGLEAWNWLQENPRPGLMITDIEMPQMDGFTLIERCRQGGMSMPILVSSSRLSEEWSKEAKRVGANDYLTKGFSTNELIDRVSSLISVPATSA